MNCMNCGNAMRPDVKFCPKCGTPAPQPAPFAPPPAEQMRTSWAATPAAAPPRRKSRAGKILLIVFGVFLVLAGGAAVAVYYGVRYFADSVKTSEPYRVAEQTLRESPAAAEALGEIKSTGFPLGTFNTEAGGGGHAAFTMSVEGTKGSGQYVVVLARQSGEWRVTSGIVRMSGGEVVTLVRDGETAAPDPPAGADSGGVPPPPPAPPGVGRPGAISVPGAVKGGALDDKATSKPDPAYPRVAQAVKARGTVVVEVAVDERGRVILAQAVSGHPLLRAAAEAAARQAKFEPTLSGGKPSKVVGTLTYEFE
jgi:TonB family protein